METKTRLNFMAELYHNTVCQNGTIHACQNPICKENKRVLGIQESQKKEKQLLYG